MPLEVSYDGNAKDAKLSWYTREMEDLTVRSFLEIIAHKINSKYNFMLNV